MTVRIVGATLRDLSYVAANLRLEDREEIDCQFDAWTPVELAGWVLRDNAYAVEINGNPEAAFGACRATHSGYWVAWSWGTRRMGRAVPRITDFVRTVMIPAIYADGGQRVEARALGTNLSAHRWLLRMGSRHCATLRNYGKNGEHFELFEWCRDDWNARLGDERNQAEPVSEEARLAPELHAVA